MDSLQQYVDHMNELLDQLVQTAQQLKEISQQVISEEDLLILQQKQEQLLEQLEIVDQDLNQYYGSEISPSIHSQFHAKLLEFQTLNQEFVDNLNSSHGLIQFDLHRLKDEDEELPRMRLQRSSEAVADKPPQTTKKTKKN